LKITIVQGAFFPVPPIEGGGVEKVWFSLGQQFVKAGHRVVHISKKHPRLPATEILNGVEHRRVGGCEFTANPLALKAKDLLYSLRVLPHLPQADILVTNSFFLPIFARRRGAGKLCVHAARYPKGQFFLYRHADRIQAVSSAVASEISRQCPQVAGRVKVLPNPLPEDVFVKQLLPHTKEKEILFVGRIHPEKGIHLLLETFARLSRTFFGWRLKIVGPWEESGGGGGIAYRDGMLALQREKRLAVEWVPPVYGVAELRKIYSEASFLVYPSLAEKGESFGLVPLEAMAAGCPVVVSDLACFREYLVPRKNGYVFDHRSSDPVCSLVDACRCLMTPDSELERIRVEGWKTANNFSAEMIAAFYLRDFENLLGL